MLSVEQVLNLAVANEPLHSSDMMLEMIKKVPRKSARTKKRLCTILGWRRRKKITEHSKREMAKARFYNKNGFAKTSDYKFNPGGTNVKPKGRGQYQRWEPECILKTAFRGPCASNRTSGPYKSAHSSVMKSSKVVSTCIDNAQTTWLQSLAAKWPQAGSEMLSFYITNNMHDETKLPLGWPRTHKASTLAWCTQVTWREAPGHVLGAANVQASGHDLGSANVQASGHVLGSAIVQASGNVLASANVQASGHVQGSANVQASGHVLGSVNVQASGHVPGSANVLQGRDDIHDVDIVRRDSTDGLCELCLSSSEAMVKLREADSNIDLPSIADGIVNDAALVLLGKLTSQAIGTAKTRDPGNKDDSAAVLISLHKSLNSFSSREGFLVNGKTFDDAEILLLLDCEEAPILQLLNVIKEFETQLANKVQLSPMRRFFSDSVVGMKAFGHAQTIAKQREKEHDLELRLAPIEERALAISSSIMFMGDESICLNYLKDKELVKFVDESEALRS